MEMSPKKIKPVLSKMNSIFHACFTFNVAIQMFLWYDCQLIFTFCTSSKLVVFKVCKAVITTDLQVYFSTFIKYYLWHIKQEETAKTNGKLRNSGVYNSPSYIA